MRGRGKPVAFQFSSASETRCREHPSSSFVGICPFCLTERLLKLLIEDRKRSPCSCSDVSSSYRNSCSALEVGNIYRRREETSKQVALLTRSNSSCIKVRERTSLWRLFGKRTEKHEFHDGKTQDLVYDQKGASRCRSVCRFGGNDESEAIVLGAKASDAANEDDASPSQEDESDFIDLDLDLQAAPKLERSSLDHGIKLKEAENLITTRKDVVSSSCRVAVDVKKRNRRGKNVLERIFKYHCASNGENRRLP